MGGIKFKTLTNLILLYDNILHEKYNLTYRSDFIHVKRIYKLKINARNRFTKKTDSLIEGDKQYIGVVFLPII